MQSRYYLFYRVSHSLFLALVLLLVGVALLFYSSFSTAGNSIMQDGAPCSPEPTDMLINYGDVLTCNFEVAGDSDMFRFIGDVGEIITLRASGSVRPCLELIAPTNNARTVACNNSSSNQIDITLNQAGTYKILLKSFLENFYGEYTIGLERLIPVSPNAREIHYSEFLTDEINPAGDMDLFFFVVNSNVTLVLYASGSVRPCIELIAPDNMRTTACNNASSNRIDITLNQTGTYAILITSHLDNFYGQYTLDLQCVSGNCPIPEQPPLVLIYAVLDNNLGDDPETWERLVNNAEAGVHAGVNVRLMIDGPGIDDPYVYDLEQDSDLRCPRLSDHTCGERYSEAKKNFKKWREDTAHPYSLRDFVTESILSHPGASRIILALAGHGSGWSANALPGQPSRYVPQPGGAEIEERVGGLLWDDYPGDGGTSRSLSTKALGAALAEIKRVTGRSIDLLYLDACSMGMTEVAYEVRNSVNYLLASPNTDWASFAYSETLKKINRDRPILEIGKEWLAAEANALDEEYYPFTLALYDLSQSAALSSTLNALSLLMNSDFVTYKPLLTAAFSNTERFESDYNGVIDVNDSYVDLQSFLVHLEQQSGLTPNITAAIQSVKSALAAFVIDQRLHSGRPWLYPDHEWRWSEARGLSIYLPLQTDEPKRTLYSAGNLQWAQATAWDELLSAYWPAGEMQAALQTAPAELPTCYSTRNCTVDLAKPLGFPKIYLPLIRK